MLIMYSIYSENHLSERSHKLMCGDKSENLRKICSYKPTFMLIVFAHLLSKHRAPRGTSARLCKLLQTGSQAPLSITPLLA